MEANQSLAYLCCRLPVSGAHPFPIAHRRSRPTSPDNLAYKSTYSNTGSPTPSISGMTHFRSKALASTILNIFCTLIEAWVEQKISDACIALAKRFALGSRLSDAFLHRRVAISHLFRDLLLLVLRKRGKCVILGSDQERNGRLRWRVSTRMTRYKGYPPC